MTRRTFRIAWAAVALGLICIAPTVYTIASDRKQRSLSPEDAFLALKPVVRIPLDTIWAAGTVSTVFQVQPSRTWEVWGPPPSMRSTNTKIPMTNPSVPPFSSRIRGAHSQIDNDFPKSARTALLHLLFELVDREYVGGWKKLACELERISRERPVDCDSEDIVRWRNVVEQTLSQLPWEKVFDFCERLHTHLAQEVAYWNQDHDQREILTSRSEVQLYIASELQRIIQEEHLAFEFSDGLVRRRGRRHTAERISRAEFVLGDPRLSASREHFNKALRYFRNVSHPDHENVIKESVCAVEAAARVLFSSAGGSTLGEVIKSVTGSEAGQLPKPIAQTFQSLYGFRSGGDGVGAIESGIRFRLLSGLNFASRLPIHCWLGRFSGPASWRHCLVSTKPRPA